MTTLWKVWGNQFTNALTHKHCQNTRKGERTKEKGKEGEKRSHSHKFTQFFFAVVETIN